MQNPILTLIKTIAFIALALAVGLVFFQRTKLEDKIERLGERISTQQASIERLGSSITKLDRRVRKGVIAAPTNGGAVPETFVPPAGEMERFAWNDKAPAWMKGRAADLWGTYGENYLKPDPHWPEMPSLDDPKLDAEGMANVWYGSAPTELNPLTVNDSDFNTRIKLYCNLLQASPHSTNPYLYRPELVYRAEVSPDYKTWILWMRPGVRWHTPQVDLEKYPHLKGDHFVTAHDFKFTMDLVMNEDVRVGHTRAYFQDFDRMEVVDDHCYIMHWKNPSFTSISANLNLVYPLPRFVYGKDEQGNDFDPATIGSQFNEHWLGKAFKYVGCGPYYLEHFNPEGEMRIRRFDDWYGEMPAIHVVQREIFPKRETHYIKFEAGEMAYAAYLAPHFQKRIESREEYTSGKWGVHWAWSTGYGFIAYRNTHPIFRDVSVRRAMTHACNRKRIIDSVLGGKGQVITGPQSMHSPTYPQDLEPLRYDLEQARTLLTEAGWRDGDSNGILEKEIDGQTVEFIVAAMIPDTGTFKTIFEIFSEDLAKIGVRLKLEPLQWGQFSKRLNDRDFDITALFWNTSGWDTDMSQIWHSKTVEDPESSNFIEFADAEVDRLIEKARRTFDLDERVKVQSAAHRRVNELQPYTFLFTGQSAAVWWKDKLSDFSKAERWKDRPRIRTWALYVPSAGSK